MPTRLTTRINTSSEAQTQRRQSVWKRHREYCRQYFNSEGAFLCDQPHPDTRSPFFHAISFLDGNDNDIDLGNRILYTNNMQQMDEQDAPILRPFTHYLATTILAYYQDRLTDENIAILKAAYLQKVKRDKIWRGGFHGYNDNYPNMDAYAILVGMNFVALDQEIVNGGIRLLKELRKLHKRRGFLSEYTSGTYSPISTQCLAEIVNHCPLEEARGLALEGEHRMWLEMASHWHPNTSSLAGPQSRAYLPDLCGHLSSIHILFYHVFGDSVFINNTNHLYPYFDEKQIRHHLGNDESIEGHTVNFQRPVYHVPQAAIELAWTKPAKSTVVATSDYGAFSFHKVPHPGETYSPQVPVGHTVCTTYHDDNFALGTSRKGFLARSADTDMFLNWRRKIPAANITDIATCYSKLYINDIDPNPLDRIANSGYSFAVHHENTALLAYHGNALLKVPQDISRIRLSLVATCFYDQPRQIRIGDKVVKNMTATEGELAPVFIDEGTIFIAVFPAVTAELPRKSAVDIRLINGFMEISFNCYQGPPRRFSTYEFLSLFAAYAIHVAPANEYEGFDSFCQGMKNFALHDEFFNCGSRETHFRLHDLQLAMETSPHSYGLRYATINDELAPEDKFSLNGNPLIKETVSKAGTLKD